MIEFLVTIPMAVIYVYIVDNTHEIRPEIYYYMVMITLLISLSTQAAGHIISILSNGNLIVFCYLNPFVFSIFHLLSGIENPIHNSPYVYQKISYLNLFRYQNELALLLQYGFGRCQAREIQLILYRLGLTDDYFYESIFRMSVMAVVYRCLALGLFYIKFNPYRNQRERTKRIISHHESLKHDTPNVIIPGLSCHHNFTIRQIQI